MKYLLTVELTREEALELYRYARYIPIRPAVPLLRSLIEIIGSSCNNCGEPMDGEELCEACKDSQSELLAISRAVERDREATTGENAPAGE